MHLIWMCPESFCDKIMAFSDIFVGNVHVEIKTEYLGTCQKLAEGKGKWNQGEGHKFF